MRGNRALQIGRPVSNFWRGPERETRRGPGDRSSLLSARKGEDPSIEDRPAGRTKFRERPGPEEIARNRIERRRAELMEELEKYKSSGLGSSHPAIVKTLDELKKIGAPLNVADEDNHPGN